MSGIPPSPSSNNSMMATMMTPSSAQAPRRIPRMATPHPKHVPYDDDDDDDEEDEQQQGQQKQPLSQQDTERKYHQHFIEAANCIPHEYTTNEEGGASATYLIRRPYGLETEPKFFAVCSSTSHELYGRRAHVSTPASMEVAVKVQADKSIMVVFGQAGVRYLITNNNSDDNDDNDDNDWKEFANVDELDRPLGNVSFIDENANEGDYSLDQVFEGALMAREHYCSSLFSTALGLYQNSIKQQAQQQQQQQVPETIVHVKEYVSDPKPETGEMCVGTEELDFPTTIQVPKKVAVEAAAAAAGTGATPVAAAAPQKDKKASPPPDENSSDVLTVGVGMFVSFFFGLLWTVLVRIPFKIFSTALAMTTAFCILSVVWLYLADDHGASLMGATTTFSYNRPGIF
jgi:hypothetical protein